MRAAREGCTVLLVQHNRHIGGMLANGLMQWDALYGGPRAPLFTELLGKIERHYIATFGKDSPAHQTMRYTHEHYPIDWVEPHVMERECNRLVAAEKGITLLLDHYPAAVERRSSARVWVEAIRLHREGRLVPGEIAKRVAQSEAGPDAAAVTRAEFDALLRGEPAPAETQGSPALTRGEVLAALWKREPHR